MKMDDGKIPQKSEVNRSSKKHDNKFELLQCRQNGVNCENHLLYINENYTQSNIYHQNKEYQNSVEALNKAFYKTFKLKNQTCAKCALMFRSTIINSLEDIHLELHSMSNGLFRKKRYKSSYIMAGNVLQNLRQDLYRE